MSAPNSNSPPPTSPAQPTLTASLEQYKAKLVDLGNLGTRLSATTTYYVSIVSALLGVLAFKERSLASIDAYIVLMVGVGGFSVSMLWFVNISFFRGLFRAKLKVLERIEESLPHQTFKDEYEQMKANGRGTWLWMERAVPITFAALFALLLIGRFR